MVSYPSGQSILNNSSTTAQDLAQTLALCLAEVADDRKGGDILVLQVADVSFIADYFVIVTGFSRTQVRAIIESMEKAAEDTCQRHPIRQEGKAEGTWVLLDYGDVIAHVLMPEQREYYDLEAFWGHAEHLPLPFQSPNEA
ncbi:ribosome silencing factor [Acaryochloris sp. IP29b_bin.137]|uniref:ribosome silencing factor n=1 Tax=Acaryochloris sp. IP29b_bin.137 TaxID=2969217 RepID=UPI002608AB5C|nr:ribosome silencing factor [Acaryochloris sp. IP29b_bin.137]